MINNKKNKNFGFTLVELLLYIGIVGIVVLSISSLYILLVGSKIKNQTVAETSQQGDQVMEIITQSLRNATLINQPTIGNSGSTLSINVADVSKNPTVFELSGSTIRITEGASQPVVLTSNKINASNLVFENLSRPNTAGIVRLHYTLTHINPSGRNEYDFVNTFWGSGALRYK